ncbi:hypothetical protein Droror1_Dr00018352 [Drosera rotundifolia]
MAHNQLHPSNTVMREYRKGNWTVQETMILIEAKRMDDERRMKRQHQNNEHFQQSNKPTELRWKWVEDYCWRRDCLRSQNQCNDKWDNLMRDYKKIRGYQRRLGDDHENHKSSYWKIEKNERKDRNLPTSMLFQVYQALAQVVEKHAAGGSGRDAAVAVAAGADNVDDWCVLFNACIATASFASYSSYTASTAVCSANTAGGRGGDNVSGASVISCSGSDSDTSEHSDSPAKRRRISSGSDQHDHHHQRPQQQKETRTLGTNHPSTSTPMDEPSSSLAVIGSAIARSASIIVEAIRASEEKQERRHRELLRLHERRLKAEESKVETDRQGVGGLVQAINNLASSILTLVSQQNQPDQPPPS